MLNAWREKAERLHVRLTLFLLLVALVPLVLVGGYGLRWSTQALEKERVQSERLHLEGLARDIEHYFTTAITDTRYLAQAVPTRNLASSLRSGDADAVASARAALAQEFIALAQARGIYFKIRFLDASGQEVVEVNAAPQGYRISEGDELEDESEDEYFVRGIALPAGGIYATRLRLETQGGVLVQPYIPGVRYATPVVLNDTPFGVIVLNVDARPLLQDLEAQNREREAHGGSNVFLLDEEGFYLWHPNPEKRWGAPWDLNTGARFQQDFPTLASILTAQTPGSIQAAETLVTYVPVRLDPYHRWTLVEVAPLARVLTPVNAFRNVFLSLMGLSLLLSVGLGVLIARSLTRPLATLSRQALRIQQGDLRPDGEVRAGGEIGVLARAFHHMREELRTLIDQVVQASRRTHAAADTLSSMTTQLRTSSEQISTAVQQVAQGASMQATEIETISQAVQQLAQMTDQIDANAARTREASETAAGQATRLEDALRALEERSAGIQQMVQTVKRFADQTNLLALNAAIEAARAGEHGRSFVVVADEVRRLAESSRQAVEEIDALNAHIQATVAELATAVADIARAVQETATLATQTAEATRHQREEAETVARSVDEIAAQSEEQAASAEEMATAVEEQMVALEELAAAAHHLSQMATQLDDLVSRFRTETASPPSAEGASERPANGEDAR